jgi:hypothetical protein
MRKKFVHNAVQVIVSAEIPNNPAESADILQKNLIIRLKQTCRYLQKFQIILQNLQIFCRKI